MGIASGQRHLTLGSGGAGLVLPDRAGTSVSSATRLGTHRPVVVAIARDPWVKAQV